MVTADICSDATVETGCPVDHDKVLVLQCLADEMRIGVRGFTWSALLLWLRFPVWIGRHEITSALGDYLTALATFLKITNEILVLEYRVAEKRFGHSGVVKVSLYLGQEVGHGYRAIPRGGRRTSLVRHGGIIPRKVQA